MNNMYFAALLLTLRLAFVSTIVLFAVGVPLAWYLSREKNKLCKSIVEAIVALPIVLPPTVLGFYLLIILSNSHIQLAFSFTGLVIGSVLYSLPFVVQPIQNAFEQIGNIPEQVALTHGASRLDYFFSVHLPLAHRGLITAAVLGFAHTMGEFGVVLMIGGNIPHKTQVISIAIYELVEQLEYSKAHVLSLIMLSIGFLFLLGLFLLNKKRT